LTSSNQQLVDVYFHTNMGSLWFRRLVKDCKNISSHIKVRRIAHGFYRIYFNRAYIHEIYKELPQEGYHIEGKDFNFTNKKYAEEYEERAELTRKIKNYVEGYWDSLDTIRTRVYMMKHNKEFNEQATKRYQTVVVK